MVGAGWFHSGIRSLWHGKSSTSWTNSSMDTRTEEAFKSQFANVLDHQTLILITHRASLLSMVDRLIVLDGGRVVADGPRQAVLDALAGGRVAAPKV